MFASTRPTHERLSFDMALKVSRHGATGPEKGSSGKTGRSPHEGNAGNVRVRRNPAIECLAMRPRRLLAGDDIDVSRGYGKRVVVACPPSMSASNGGREELKVR